jgi:Heparinase II/III-like protein
LIRLLDQTSGRLPNLGPNDSAYILPLTTCPFYDYRPVLQAACIAFLGGELFEPGPWNEMSMWTCPQTGEARTSPAQLGPSALPADVAPFRIDNPSSASWAYFRVANFTSRPGHADQLHVDLWWRGTNIAQDAGTYLYNHPPPWDNSLAHTAVHNTLTVNDRDQMTHAGRFLWLDWAQARLLAHHQAEDNSWERLSAQHDGYRQFGIYHQRSVTALTNGCWTIEDGIITAKQQNSDQSKDISPLFTVRLHWLLPDLPWEIELDGTSAVIHLVSPHGPLVLKVSYSKAENQGMPVASLAYNLVRAGECVFGSGRTQPNWGWVSETYAQLIPALSFSLEIRDCLPIHLVSEWKLA